MFGFQDHRHAVVKLRAQLGLQYRFPCAGMVNCSPPPALARRGRTILFRRRPHRRREAWPPEVGFAVDSPLEEGVSCELVSEMPKFPASRCSSRPPSATIGSKSIAEFNGLRSNSLLIGTGNLIRPCRELFRAIREFFRLIRESRAGRDFTAPEPGVFAEHSRAPRDAFRSHLVLDISVYQL